MGSVSISRSVIVGLFIFLGIVIFAVAVFTIGSQQKTFEKTISLKAIFEDVGGLQAGNNVWLSGVKIGTVKKLRFMENTEVEVQMNVERQAQSLIRKDARVKISTDGFIGNRIVVIYGGTPFAGLITGNDYLRTETGESTDKMLATLRISNNNIDSITEDLKWIIRRVKNGKGSLGELIENPSIANYLKEASIHIRTASSHAENAVATLNKFLAGLNRKGTLPNELVTDTLTYAEIRDAIQKFDQAAASVARAAGNIEQAAGALKRTDNPAGVILGDKQVANDMKAITKNLKTSSEKLDEDLQALQHNFLLKGYFKKQEKQKNKADTTGKTSK